MNYLYAFDSHPHLEKNIDSLDFNDTSLSGPWIYVHPFQSLSDLIRPSHQITLGQILEWGYSSSLSPSFLEFLTLLEDQDNDHLCHALLQDLCQQWLIGQWGRLCCNGILIWNDELKGWRIASISQGQIQQSQSFSPSSTLISLSLIHI